MNKFLYFAAGANDGAAYPVEALRQVDISAGKLNFYFSPARITDVAASDSVDVVICSVGADEKSALANVVAAINAHPNGDPFVVIADSENSVFPITGVTACDSITVAT